MTEARLCIASHAADSDYAPSSRVLLWKLGYALVPAAEASEPSLRVVRDDRLGEVAATPGVPIILLTRERSARTRDPRVAGTLRRPARLHELFRLIQAALEEHPRFVPRVPASLRGTGESEDQHWDFEVRSLSENGCLVTGAKLPRQGTSFELDIVLPATGILPLVSPLIDGMILIRPAEKCSRRVARGSCPPRALSRSGQGDFHHPAPPWRRLVATDPRFGP